MFNPKANRTFHYSVFKDQKRHESSLFNSI